MRVLVVIPHYVPDGGPSAPLFAMLCEQLVRRGHAVTVLAAVPHYPSGQVPHAYRGPKVRRTVEHGVRVIRVPLASVDRSKLEQRLFQFLAYQVGAVLAGWRIDCDVLVSVTSSMEVFLPYTYFSVLRGRPTVYSVHDVYPDAGIQLGIFRHKPIIKLITYLEQRCANRAAIVRILSQSFEEGVRRLGVPETKIRLIYDWVDTDLITPLPKANPFAVEHNLDKSFVVLYAGNLGLSQGLEPVLEAAQALADEDIQFVLVGEGATKAFLLQTATSRQLTNVTFLPFQPRARLPEVLATADLSLVMLRQGMGLHALPSKTLSILASGRPMIASIDPGSDTWSLVERSESGVCIPPEDPVRLVETIRSLKNNPMLCREMGQKGREYALHHHSPAAAADAFEEILSEAIASTKGQKGHS